MGDLKSSRLIILKGFLFLLSSVVAAGVLLGENFTLRTAFLLFVAIWSACRFYYFAFYVIEKYVDPSFKFSSLWAFARYFWRRSEFIRCQLKSKAREISPQRLFWFR